MADSKEASKHEDKDNWKPEDNSDASSQEDPAPKRKQPPGNVVRPSRNSIVIKIYDCGHSSIRAILGLLDPLKCILIVIQALLVLFFCRKLLGSTS
jgi:hypothetical protein